MFIYKQEFKRLIELKRGNETFHMVGFLRRTYEGTNALNVLMNMLQDHLFDGCDGTTYVYHDSDHIEFHVDGFEVILHAPDELQAWDGFDLYDVLNDAQASQIAFDG